MIHNLYPSWMTNGHAITLSPRQKDKLAESETADFEVCEYKICFLQKVRGWNIITTLCHTSLFPTISETES